VALVTAEAESELGHLAEGDQSCVYRCDPEDADALVESIRRLNLTPGLADRIGHNAKSYADKHIAMDQVLAQFENKLKSIC